MVSSDTFLNGLNAIFPAGVQTLTELPDSADWSATYRVFLRDGEVYYLKGTPRPRPEAAVTAHLYQHVPHLIPRPVVLDLLPTSSWQWFVLEDAGDCDRADVLPEVAVEIVMALARLQYRVSTDSHLKTLLPDCSPEYLYSVTLAVCEWAASLAYPMARDEFSALKDVFTSCRSPFAELEKHLSLLAPTCVHGDLFPGNIALSDRGIRFIDWADCVWGVGGASVYNLLAACHVRSDSRQLSHRYLECLCTWMGNSLNRYMY